MRHVCLTVDAEPDCPPYLWTWRGMEEGAPWLLDTLAAEGVPGTFFTTGDAAMKYPDFVQRLVDEGHELGCHGMSHRAFPDLTPAEAREEVEESAEILRRWGIVTSFRAPYLRFPDAYLGLLESNGFRLDSSRGKYKPAHWRGSASSTLTRVPASVTSSWLRLPSMVRDPVLRSLQSPVVLFVHPWEYVDLRGEPIPWDSRAGTGRRAREALVEVIGALKEEGARFLRMDQLEPSGSEA